MRIFGFWIKFQWNDWWFTNIGLCNGLVPSGNKPLPELILTKPTNIIWHYQRLILLVDNLNIDFTSPSLVRWSQGICYLLLLTHCRLDDIQQTWWQTVVVWYLEINTLYFITIPSHVTWNSIEVYLICLNDRSSLTWCHLGNPPLFEPGSNKIWYHVASLGHSELDNSKDNTVKPLT